MPQNCAALQLLGFAGQFQAVTCRLKRLLGREPRHELSCCINHWRQNALAEWLRKLKLLQRDRFSPTTVFHQSVLDRVLRARSEHYNDDQDGDYGSDGYQHRYHSHFPQLDLNIGDLVECKCTTRDQNDAHAQHDPATRSSEHLHHILTI